jgi:two-component system, NarL family, nitrate/nitrite sensor histidine kinase NarX
VDQKTSQNNLRPLVRWLPLGAALFAFLSGLVYLLLQAFWVSNWPSNWQLAAGFVLLALWTAAVYWAIAKLVQFINEQRNLSRRIVEIERQVGEAYQRLAAAFRIREQFSEASNEEEIIQLLLNQVVELTGAAGASFVPLDEHRHPLPAVSIGRPPVVLPDAWLEYLASPAIRSRCGACEQRNHFVSTCPLLSGPISNAAGIYCIPLKRADREFGVLNVYIPDQSQPDLEAQVFLNSLVKETTQALEAVWLRRRELDTLQKIQAVRQKSELNTLLTGLLENVYNTLEPDFAVLILKEMITIQDTDRSNVLPTLREHLVIGELPDPARDGILRYVQQVIESGSSIDINTGIMDKAGVKEDWSVIAVPLQVEGESTGALLAACKRPQAFNQRQLTLLETAAGQIALVIQNTNRIADLEFKVMMDERTRLAREIHDGMAQTLGFLKLQVAQMHSYLERGEIERLKNGIDLYYETLSEAYQDARHAIDGLRISPVGSQLEEWLQQTLAEFQENIDKQNLTVEVDCPVIKREIPSEVQAQLVRIVQEALSNIRKHARACHVLVSCMERNGDLILEIHDDGQGFSAEDVPGPSHHGLRGMRERAELIGADFQIISRSQKGTTVRVSLPLTVGELPV